MKVKFAADYCDREVTSGAATTKGFDVRLVIDLMMQAIEKRY